MYPQVAWETDFLTCSYKIPQLEINTAKMPCFYLTEMGWGEVGKKNHHQTQWEKPPAEGAGGA